MTSVYNQMALEKQSRRWHILLLDINITNFIDF